MVEGIQGRPVRVGFYGSGNIAKNTHIPIVSALENVDIVGLCDVDATVLEEAGAVAGVEEVHLYTDAMEMLEREELDVLFSCVPAFVRDDSHVEAVAASKGIHLFSEKPQAVDIETARRIDGAIRDAGVLSTVGFRERYRPLFSEVRDFLSDKEITHAQVTMPRLQHGERPWSVDEEVSGGFLLEWGCHALDYTRFMTGQDVSHVQAFISKPEGHDQSVSN